MKKLLAYKEIYLIVSLFLAVVVTAQMLVFDDAYFEFLGLYRERQYRQSRYEYVIELANKDAIEDAINNIPDAIADYLDITLVGYSLTHNDRLLVTTFYPRPHDDRFLYVDSGKSAAEISQGEAICNVGGIASSMDEHGNQYVSVRDKVYKLVGVGNTGDAYSGIDYMNTLYSVQLTYEDYFDVVSKVKEIVIQYEQPLTLAQEHTLSDYINFKLGYEEYVEPEVMDNESVNSLFMRLLFIIIMLVLCLVCNFSIISYLFFKLSDEYQVRTICGAKKYQILLAKMGDLLIAGITSFAIGSIGYLVLINAIERNRTSLDSLKFIGVNFLIYIVVLYVVFGIGSLFTRGNQKGGVYGSID